MGRSWTEQYLVGKWRIGRFLFFWFFGQGWKGYKADHECGFLISLLFCFVLLFCFFLCVCGGRGGEGGVGFKGDNCEKTMIEGGKIIRLINQKKKIEW